MRPIKSLNPLPSHEGRLIFVQTWELIKRLNPLPSHEGRRGRRVGRLAGRVFKSTPFSRRETTSVSAGPSYGNV